jgi:hypothetical protein
LHHRGEIDLVRVDDMERARAGLVQRGVPPELIDRSASADRDSVHRAILV